jgi:hypothetical protein
MTKVINVVIVLCSITLLSLGVYAMFFPLKAFELFQLKPVGLYGYNTMRGINGGLYLFGSFSLILGLITKNKTWYHAVMLVVAIIMTGRTISFIFDGWINEALKALVTEVVLMVTLFFALKQKEKSK